MRSEAEVLEEYETIAALAERSDGPAGRRWLERAGALAWVLEVDDAE